MSELDWLNDETWAVLEPRLPKNRLGAPLVDDRRVIRGILHVLRSGCRWKDYLPEYGAVTTIDNRYNRWSAQGFWHKLFARLATAGKIADISVVETLLDDSVPPQRLLAYKSYNANHLRQHLQALGTEVVMPFNKTRRHPYLLDRIAYRRRNVVEPMFCRRKDWQRIATCYDGLTENFLSAVVVVATIYCWLP